jgi:hypothetical protein
LQEGGGTGGFASCRFVSLGHHRSGAREAGNLAGIYSRSRAAGYVSGSVDDARAYPRSGMPRRGHPGWPCGVRPTQPTGCQMGDPRSRNPGKFCYATGTRNPGRAKRTSWPPFPPPLAAGKPQLSLVKGNTVPHHYSISIIPVNYPGQRPKKPLKNGHFWLFRRIRDKIESDV